MKELVIVMPTYNEEEIIESVVSSVYHDIVLHLPGSKLLVVNDGSTDSTASILNSLSFKYNNIEVVHKPNGGHGSAVLCGLKKANSNYIFLMDSDGQYLPKEFWKLWDKRTEHDLLIGIRKKRHDPFSRKMLTRLIRLFIFMIFGTYIYDSNSPFKLFKKELWDKIKLYTPSNILTPSMFLAIVAGKLGYKIYSIPVQHLPRTTGVCSIRYIKLLSFCFRGFKQLLELRFRIIWGKPSKD